MKKRARNNEKKMREEKETEKREDKEIKRVGKLKQKVRKGEKR